MKLKNNKFKINLHHFPLRKKFMTALNFKTLKINTMFIDENELQYRFVAESSFLDKNGYIFLMLLCKNIFPISKYYNKFIINTFLIIQEDPNFISTTVGLASNWSIINSNYLILFPIIL